MSTHSIGVGKVNIATTFDQADARMLGRIAFAAGKSRNEWVREVVLAAMVKAGRIAVTAALLGALGLAILEHQDMRRAPRPARLARRRWEEQA